MIIAGTGPRRIVQEDWMMTEFTDTMTDILKQGKAVHGDKLIVISGMAEGFDEALAKAAIRATVPFHAFLPTDLYGAYYWSEKNSMLHRDRTGEFYELLAQAAHQVVCSATTWIMRGTQKYHANLLRNEMMVDAADKIWTP